MLVVFGTAKLLAELSERLGQPGLMGEILATESTAYIDGPRFGVIDQRGDERWK